MALTDFSAILKLFVSRRCRNRRRQNRCQRKRKENQFIFVLNKKLLVDIFLSTYSVSIELNNIEMCLSSLKWGYFMRFKQVYADLEKVFPRRPSLHVTLNKLYYATYENILNTKFNPVKIADHFIYYDLFTKITFISKL